MTTGTEAVGNGSRFAQIFKAMMLLCALVWIWGMALIKVWPWQKGGEWLPDFPIVAVCTGPTVCALPFAELEKARADGRLQSLEPPAQSGETAYELLSLQWNRLSGGVETKVSAWNFQTTVRYRIENDRPVLVEYQEISGKVFLLAIGGALLTLIGIYLRKLRK